MRQLNAGNDNGSIPEPFEAKHDIDPWIDVPMILLDQVAQMLQRATRRVGGQQAISFHLTHRAV